MRPFTPVAAGALAVGVAAAMLWGLDGWHYYLTPIDGRGASPLHPLLRPSGSAGLALGVAGTTAMLGTLPYAARRHWPALARIGAAPRWLDAHIFFGILGPVLVTFHTAFKFNGLVAVAYWLMMTVWASGFVGRYLYARIPRTIRGVELSRDAVDGRLDDARTALEAAPLPVAMRHELSAFHEATMPPPGRTPRLLDLLVGEIRVRLRVRRLRRALRAAGVDVRLVERTVALATERALLLRRLAHLQRTRRLFAWWHFLHRPLVLVMFVIVLLHVGVALYLGYAAFGM